MRTYIEALPKRGSPEEKRTLDPSTLLRGTPLHEFSPADLLQALDAFEESVVVHVQSAVGLGSAAAS